MAPPCVMEVKKLCMLYSLPLPLLLLADPPQKDSFSKLVKLNVLDYWQTKLRADADPVKLPSLTYFKPQFMSLSRPHLLWTTCGNNVYQLNKACIQAKYLSGRFRTERLLSNFAVENSPFCQLHPEQEQVGDLLHHLVSCPSLSSRRTLLFEYWDQVSNSCPPANEILLKMKTTSPEYFLQFVLDCSVLPDVIAAAQIHGMELYNILFKATRTYCYSLYRARLKLLDRWI